VVVAGGPHHGCLLLGTLATASCEPSAAIIGGLARALFVMVISIRQKGLIAYDARHPGAEDRDQDPTAKWWGMIWRTWSGGPRRPERVRRCISAVLTTANGT
jgi:hypothetical protein